MKETEEKYYYKDGKFTKVGSDGKRTRETYYYKDGKFIKTRSDGGDISFVLILVILACLMFWAIPIFLLILLIKSIVNKNFNKKDRVKDIVSQMESYNITTHEQRIDFLKSKTEKIRLQSNIFKYSIFTILGVSLLIITIVAITLL